MHYQIWRPWAHLIYTISTTTLGPKFLARLHFLVCGSRRCDLRTGRWPVWVSACLPIMGSLGGGQVSGSRLPASKIGYTYHFFWASAFCFYICTICIFTFVFLHLHNLYNFTVLLPTYFPHYSALIGPRDGMLGNLPNNLNTTWLYFGLNRSKKQT